MYFAPPARMRSSLAMSHPSRRGWKVIWAAIDVRNMHNNACFGSGLVRRDKMRNFVSCLDGRGGRAQNRVGEVGKRRQGRLGRFPVRLVPGSRDDRDVDRAI